MITEFRAVNQSEIDFSLTITMPLQEWRRLSKQLEAVPAGDFPAWRVVSSIREMVAQANTHWVEEATE